MQWLGNLFSWIGLSGSQEPVNTIDNDGDINMSNDTENSGEDIDNNDIDYTVFKPGDTVYYKDVACKVIEIHHSVFPPRATVQQIINGTEVNTEFTNLISAETFVQSQNDTITKEIFEKSESLLAINDNDNNNNKGTDTDTKPKPKPKPKPKAKSIKNKTKSKKKSGSKKKKHIAQIQRAPRKSKRRQRVMKRKKSKKKSRSAKTTNSRSAKRNLKKVKKKKLASKNIKSVKGSESVSKTPKKNERKRRLTEIGIENTNKKKVNKNKIKSPPKKRRRMTEPVDINDVEKLVEKIYGERINNGNIEYLMKFKGHKKDESIWAKNNGTDSCKQAIKQFKKDLKNDQKSKYMSRVVREMNSKKKK